MKAIVLAADNHYIEKVEVLMKSICAYNQQIVFYIFHEDIPKEWFIYIEPILEKVQCKIVDVNMIEQHLRYQTHHAHINHVTYFRYLIGKIVPEDIVLYLDIDIIVTGDVMPLFNIDLKDCYIGAVDEPNNKLGEFNAGVMLINNRLWKEENISDKLIQLTNDYIDRVSNGDQSILNIAFTNRWLALPRCYNTMIGLDKILEIYGCENIMEDISTMPIIIHYITEDKPWKQFSSSRLRDVYWFYYTLQWGDIIGKWKIHNHDTTMFTVFSEKKAFIATDSYDMEQLETLIKALPLVQFNIAALTHFGNSVVALSRYRNVFLYPNVLQVTLEKLLDDCDVYLDINHYSEVDNIVERASQKGKRICAFDVTRHRLDMTYAKIVSVDQVEELIDYIQQI